MAMADKRRIFEAHGVLFAGESGDELIGRCPFTGKDDKFYVNQKSWLWDSKTSGKSGNIPRFLEMIQQKYRWDMNGKLLEALCRDRGLPPDAFTDWQFGWNGSAYTLAVRDGKGLVVDIRTYKLGGRMMSTPGCEVGMLGADLIASDPAAPIYVCEGEWDCIAWSWLRNRMNAPGIVVGLPGATTFKAEWVQWFTGRTTHGMMDNDAAGGKGNVLLGKRLKTVVQRLTVLDWPSGFPEGFDIRDLVVKIGIKKNDLPKAWRFAHERFVRHTSTVQGGGGTPGENPPTPLEAEREEIKKRPSAWAGRTPTLADVEGVVNKWLWLDNTDGLKVVLATALTLRIAADSDPVWLFLVAPPGGAKTETLNTLSDWEDIYAISSLTPHSLISGAPVREGQDPSLIPRLNNKVLIIKDFTAILAMNDNDKEMIFGVLRDAYDGSCAKSFGNGVERKYESRFNVIAAVTPSIYDLSSKHTSLGERFLKFSMGDNLHHLHEDQMLDRAMDNSGQETLMRAEMSDVVSAFITAKLKEVPADPKEFPHPTPEVRRAIRALVKFGGRMRGSVSRDTYKNDIITSRPSSEVPTRLVKQVIKLARGLAMVLSHKIIGWEEYHILKQLILNTIPQRNEDLIRKVAAICPKDGDAVTSQELAAETKYPIATVNRIMQDFNVLEIVKREGNVTRHKWLMSPYIRGCITEAHLYGIGTSPDGKPAQPFNGGRPVNGARVRVRKKAFSFAHKTQADGEVKDVQTKSGPMVRKVRVARRVPSTQNNSR